MRKLTVNLGAKSYHIEIGAHILSTLGEKIAGLSNAERVAIISDDTVDALYGETLAASLRAAGFVPTRIVFAHGEQSKCLAVLADIYEAMQAAGLTRSDLVVTLGGGVTGDLGGFAAATFLRGIDFVQVPTTLLAQIDSSIGGKVAVDLPAGKNLVGNFYQPKGVFIDTELLRTLPVHFLHDGLGEAIKYGCLADAELFELLEGYQDDEELLANIDNVISRCCAIKARIVEHDEFDTGERMLLNFGHTLGHAIEKCSHFEGISHGEAVGVGMLMLTEQSEGLGLTELGSAERLKALLAKYALPTATEFSAPELLAAIGADKKKSGKSITLVLMKAIGQCYLHKIAMQDLPAYVR